MLIILDNINDTTNISGINNINDINDIGLNNVNDARLDKIILKIILD